MSLRFDLAAMLLPPKPELTKEGFLRCYVRIGRTGDLHYTNKDGTKRSERVPRKTLFSKESISSFMLKPVSDEHPSVGKITPLNADKYQVGTLGHYPVEDGDFLGFAASVTHQRGIDTLVRSDHRKEASSAYDTEVIQLPDGTYEQQKREGNHVAIVKAGRAGSIARFYVDSADDDDTWFQADEAIDYYTHNDVVEEVLKDLRPKLIWTPRRIDKKEEARRVQILIGKRVFNIDGDEASAVADAIARLQADSEELSGVKAKLTDAEKRISDLQSQLDSTEGKLDAAETALGEARADAVDTANLISVDEMQVRMDLWEDVTGFLKSENPDFRRDNSLTKSEIQAFYLSKRFPHLKLDGKSEDYINALYENMEPKPQDVKLRTNYDDALHDIWRAREDGRGGMMNIPPEEIAKEARMKRRKRIEENGRIA